MAYIKSHSNYVLKKKHQRTDDGVIYERDYTTIGGIDNFAARQVPKYKSGNFIITINDENVQYKSNALKNWAENEHGTTWTYSDVQDASAETEYTEDKIVLKNDYYKLSDFAYYGSCAELVRGSVNGILSTFPGELYVTDSTMASLNFYIDGDIEKRYNNALFVDNPFNIDIYTEWVTDDNDEKQLKYLAANEHWVNYEILDNDEEVVASAFTVNVKSANTICNKDEIEYAKRNNLPIPNPKYRNGAIIYSVRFEAEGMKTFSIICVKYNQNLIYFIPNNNGENDFAKGYHIRPKKSFIDKFFNSLDSFQSVILNPKSDPKYTVYFEIMSEGEYGYDTSVQSFTFPTTYGGYNIGSDEAGINSYISRFVSISEFYDTHFSDNLYRMLTHDSIKNFDWSYTKGGNENSEYTENGEKLAQVIRLFGREFDEIKFYIDGITHYNQITYNDKNNIPDYFLSDELATEGFDVKSIYPLTLNEFITGCTEEDGDFKYYRGLDESGLCFTSDFENITAQAINENENIVIGNNGTIYKLNRIFNQDIKTQIKPYTNERLKYKFGYFNICDDRTGGTIDDCDGKYAKEAITEENKNKKTKLIRVGDAVLKKKLLVNKRIKKYSSEKEYSYKDINRMFLKRLKLNSRHILRHKGTIQGVEMMFGMFGLVSKNFVNKYAELYTESAFTENFPLSVNDWDYDIKEYTTVTNPILDPYWCCKGMPRIDWYNSTKTIQYNTVDFKNGIYHSYQGLPIKHRDIYVAIEKTDDGYVISGNSIYDAIIDKDIKEVISYNKDTFELVYMKNDSSSETTLAYKYHNIYPYFNGEDRYDGNPYYQMNGGWLCNSPYSFDNNNNIMSKEDSCVFTETVDTLKIVENIKQLVDLPVNELMNGEIYKVNHLDGEYLLIDGYLYTVYKDFKNNRYINIIVANNSVTIGYHTFSEKIYVSDVYGNCNLNNDDNYSTEGNDEIRMYDISWLDNGESIRIYLKWNNGFDGIVAQDDYEFGKSNIKINGAETRFVNDGVFSENISGTPTNYFKIIDRIEKQTFLDNGWVQLSESSEDYIKANSVKNYFNGNNPHTGHFNYDGGFSYMNYFARLFNASYDANLFDERKYEGNFEQEYEYIGEIGFKNLITPPVCNKDYTLSADSKIHFFGDWFDISGDTETEHHFDRRDAESWYDYNDYAEQINELKTAYTACTIEDDSVEDDERYVCIGIQPDGETSQIVNTKVVEITINILGGNCEGGLYSKDAMEEIKYYQDVVMPYVAQMIPSTAIVKVTYKLKQN